MSADHDLVAAALPGYEVGGELGRGGWGVVLEGRHRQLGRLVAIKQLPLVFANDPDVRARFVTEARLLAALDHPHIVPIYDYVEHEGLCLLVMEKLPGGTVWDRFRRDALNAQTSCAVVLATCAGLQCAHEHGVLHRDVKPENLMFSAAGSLKVTDFGIAKMLGGGHTLATKAGEVVGTPVYMAPEQARGDPLSPATDIYAAGTMLYELLTGRLPFPDKGDPMATLYQHVHEVPQPILSVAPNVPAPIAEVVMRAIATSAGDRYASAEDLGVALSQAAGQVWGPAWLAGVGMPVLSAGPIAGAPSGSAAGATATAATAAPPTVSPAVSPAVPAAVAPPTVAPGTAAPVVPPPTEGPGRPWEQETVPLHPDARPHSGRAVLTDVSPTDLVPVEHVLPSATPTRVPVLAALGLLLLTVAVAFIGVSSPAHAGQVRLTVNGVDPTVATPTLDLSKPVHVAGTIGAGASDADHVRLSFSVLNLTLGSRVAPVSPPSGGAFATDVDASGSRYLAAGRLTADVTLLHGSTRREHRSFAARARQPALLSAPGAGGVALLLFVVATAESLLRSMRRGRRGASGFVGMLLVGTAFGAGAVAAAWLLGVTEPTGTTVVVCAVVGAAGGGAAAEAARRAGRRRAMRRVAA